MTIQRLSAISTTCCGVVLIGAVAQAQPMAQAPPVTPEETSLFPPPSRPPRIAPELEAGAGLGIPTGGLDAGPSFFGGGGVRVAAGPGSFAVGLRVGFQTFATEGEGVAPSCEGSTRGACIAGGSFVWELDEQILSFAAPLSYRFLRPDRLFVPYITFAPQLFISESTVTAFGFRQSQGDQGLGFAALAGGRLKLGPGGAFVEAGYQYAAIEPHAPNSNLSITGEGNVGAVTVMAGYRLELEHL